MFLQGGTQMSEVLKEMKERRSIRKYKSDMVPQEILDQISKQDYMQQVEKELKIQ